MKIRSGFYTGNNAMGPLLTPQQLQDFMESSGWTLKVKDGVPVLTLDGKEYTSLSEYIEASTASISLSLGNLQANIQAYINRLSKNDRPRPGFRRNSRRVAATRRDTSTIAQRAAALPESSPTTAHEIPVSYLTDFTADANAAIAGGQNAIIAFIKKNSGNVMTIFLITAAIFIIWSATGKTPYEHMQDVWLDVKNLEQNQAVIEYVQKSLDKPTLGCVWKQGGTLVFDSPGKPRPKRDPFHLDERQYVALMDRRERGYVQIAYEFNGGKTRAIKLGWVREGDVYAARGPKTNTLFPFLFVPPIVE